MRTSLLSAACAVTLLCLGCSSGGGSEASATSRASATATATEATPASASAKPMSAECPAGSKGPGTLKEPCEASGQARLVELTWAGKADDKGVSFKMVNKATKNLLFGRLYLYFYDKAGKQLEVDDGGKKSPYKLCTGSVFGGLVRAEEKLTAEFDCVKKSDFPAGTATVEAELQTVGFADSTGMKADLYWTNRDLAPDARTKGGAK